MTQGYRDRSKKGVCNVIYITNKNIKAERVPPCSSQLYRDGRGGAGGLRWERENGRGIELNEREREKNKEEITRAHLESYVLMYKL